MIFGFLATSLLLLLWVKLVVGRNNRKTIQAQQNYWEWERKANEVRKQPLDNLAFLSIPFDTLPFGILTDEKTQSDEAFIRTFTEKKAVNLTGISNTELKYKYGAANLPVLTSYDDNYTLLVRTMNGWAERLYHAGYTVDARTVSEYLVQTGTDTSCTYLLLTDIYLKENDHDSIERLLRIVEGSSFTLKNAILRDIKSKLPVVSAAD